MARILVVDDDISASAFPPPFDRLVACGPGLPPSWG